MSLRFCRVIVIALGLWGLVAPFKPIWAHSELLTADPAPGAQLTTSPDKIHLSFTAPLALTSTLALYSAQFQMISNLRPVIGPANPQHMVATVPSLSPGVYTVQWRAISTDRDMVMGSYQFVVIGHPGHNNHMIVASAAALTFLTLVILFGLTKRQRINLKP